MPLNSRGCKNMTDAEFLAHFLTSGLEFSIMIESGYCR